MEKTNSFVFWLQGRSRLSKLSILALIDLVVCLCAAFLAHALRTSSFDLPSSSTWHLLLIAPVLSLTAALLAGTYWAATRTYSYSVERQIVGSQAVAMIAWIFVLFLLGTEGFPRAIVAIYALLSIAGMIMVRKIAALFMGADLSGERRKSEIRVLVFGAGHQGLQIVETLKRNPNYRAVAFLDTDYSWIDRRVGGLLVYDLENIKEVVRRHQPTEIIIAKPNLGRATLRKFFALFRDNGLTAKLFPNVGELVDGQVKLAELREIRLEDLLGRDSVSPFPDLMNVPSKQRVVMITGAGGSIGSEIARQVAHHQPQKLILLDNSEFALFEIHRELEQLMTSGDIKSFNLVPVLADVKNKKDMIACMKENQVEVVFHAAAYKHVRMVQENVTAGVQNNVFGTLAAGEAACECGVKRFVLISTDKAVRPTNVMGATKRIAEQVIQNLAMRPGQSTVFAMVRFGNVLGSTGSVVPIFREQISRGGPVTVTHPEVSRYFMLIPEAAQLVVQACALAKGGEVFVLDMGEPVRILHLAQTMIELSGRAIQSAEDSEGDIAINFVGLKEGEKLHEELELGSNLKPTIHSRILHAQEERPSQADLNRQLHQLEKLVQQGSSTELAKLVMTMSFQD